MLWLHASSGFVQSEEVRRGLHGFGPESSIHILQLALSHMYHYVCQPTTENPHTNGSGFIVSYC